MGKLVGVMLRTGLVGKLVDVMLRTGLVGKLVGVKQRPNCRSTSVFSWTRVDDETDQDGLGGRSILTGFDKQLSLVDLGK
jgi:hypothetical protein